MSGNAHNSPEARPKRLDARVRRSRDKLGDALMELITQKPFDAITVQEVLDRAGVGRATFYTHYRDKQDLFLSDVEDFMEMMAALLTRHGAAPRRIAPVRELFAHVAEVRDFYESLEQAGKLADVLELGTGYFARSIEQRLQTAGAELEGMELRTVSHALAAALFSMLESWLAGGKVATPEEMDVLFHRLVWRGVRAPRKV